MNKIIDVEALSNMPITKEFSELLFGENAFNVQKIPNDNIFIVECNDIYYNFNKNGNILCWQELDKGNAEIKIFYNHFQIVRYIDNYLQQQNRKRINSVYDNKQE